VVINGIVFAASTGSSSVLYAFDGSTGKELFNSGSTITGGLAHSGAISGSAGQLYLSTADSTLYAFGIPLVPPDLAAKTKN
jgi:outer membrane protein assembly factor BamB